MDWNCCSTSGCGTTFSKRYRIRLSGKSVCMSMLMSTCRCSRLPWLPLVPGGWCRSLEKSTHGGPVVIRMITSGLSWIKGWISRLMVARSSVVMSPC